VGVGVVSAVYYEPLNAANSVGWASVVSSRWLHCTPVNQSTYTHYRFVVVQPSFRAFKDSDGTSLICLCKLRLELRRHQLRVAANIGFRFLRGE